MTTGKTTITGMVIELIQGAEHPGRAGAWVAVRLDPYFRTHFAKRRMHKPAQSAIIATARRLLEIARDCMARAERKSLISESAANQFESRVAESLGYIRNTLAFGAR